MTLDIETLKEISAEFDTGSEAVYLEPFGSGHINRTFRITCRDGRRFILQMISKTLTDFPDKLMDNIVYVTNHLRSKERDPRKVLTPVFTRSSQPMLSVPSGSWRMYCYVEDSFCPEGAGTEEEFYLAASAFGRFEEQLADFDPSLLFESLPDFHNTPFRFGQFHEALKQNIVGRKAEVSGEIEFLLAHEEEAGMLQRMRESGELPVRVTHNDTKLNNVLFDSRSRKPLCVIDLDTVMPGLSLYDFGDAIRFGASTAAEDEKDLDKVCLSLHRYRLFRKGFQEACPGLTPLEKELLPMGAKVITTEQAARFLTDYLNGDRYYHITYAEQNLNRTRTQIRLVQEMERNWAAMNR